MSTNTPDINAILNAPGLKAGQLLVIGARRNQGRTQITDADTAKTLMCNVIVSPHCPPNSAFVVDTKALAKLAEKSLWPYIEELKRASQ